MGVPVAGGEMLLCSWSVASAMNRRPPDASVVGEPSGHISPPSATLCAREVIDVRHHVDSQVVSRGIGLGRGGGRNKVYEIKRT